MYFCTYSGLSVYDGVRFTNYNQLNGLTNEVVNDVIEIAPDSFLVATNSSSLNTLVHGQVGNFHTVDNFYPLINRLFKTKDGQLIAAADDGLFILSDQKFIRLPTLDSEGKDIGQNLDKITEWKNYLLIVPWNQERKEKLLLFDRQSQKITDVFTTSSLYSVSINLKGEIWLSTIAGINLLDTVALQKGKINLLPLPVEYHDAQYKNQFIFFDQNQNTWLYYSNQIIIISPDGQRQIISDKEGLKAGSIVDLLVDKEGITWMASDGNGIIKLPGTHVHIMGDLKPGTKNNFSVVYQQSDTTWLFNNTDNSFYQIHDGHLNSFSLGRTPVNVVNMYIQGEKLYFISGHQIFSIEHKDLAAAYSHPVQITLDTSPIVNFGAILVDPYGGIIQYARPNDSSYYLAVTKNSKLQMKLKISFAVDQLALDPSKNLWVATRNNQLMVYSLHPELPSGYLRLKNNYSKELGVIGPRSIVADLSGDIWIGTRSKGIYRLHFEEEKLKSAIQLTTVQGLTDNFYYYLYCDPDSNIWAGSQTGLDKISFQNGEYIIENITKSKNIFFGIYKIITAEKGVIWALTSNGEIITISNTAPVKLPKTPSFFITSILVNEKGYYASSTRFAHDQNNFSFRVAAPSFTDEKSILYSYYLAGSGKNNWSQPSNNALFNFINLAPGVYTLHVKAEFPAALYPPQTLIYKFTIRPPYWQTWWFRIVLVTILLSLLTLVVRYYYARKLEKQRLILESKQAMEKERTRIATDMHDDLGAGLTRIKFLSETIGLKKQLHQPVEAEIQSIRTYAHEMIDKMGEIVWALNEKNDSLSDLLAYTRAYAVEYLSENGLKCIVNAPDDFTSLVVSGEFRRNIYLGVKEALHNIVKHAQANTVTIYFEIHHDLVIRIHDDGIGFDPGNTRPYSNGLLNMRKRMIDVGGTMEIKNENGTTIILCAPLSS